MSPFLNLLTLQWFSRIIQLPLWLCLLKHLWDCWQLHTSSLVESVIAQDIIVSTATMALSWFTYMVSIGHTCPQKPDVIAKQKAGAEVEALKYAAPFWGEARHNAFLCHFRLGWSIFLFLILVLILFIFYFIFLNRGGHWWCCFQGILCSSQSSKLEALNRMSFWGILCSSQSISKLEAQ